MGNEVFANGMEVSCKSGDGKVIAAFPDVCLSPPSPPAGPIPVPYPNTSFSKDGKNGSKTVKEFHRQIGEFADVDVEWLTGNARLHVVHGTTRLHCTPGRHVSLLAVHGPARGIRTDGLRWELKDEDLEPGATRGVSNVFEKPVATVTVRDGTLLAVLTGDPSV